MRRLLKWSVVLVVLFCAGWSAWWYTQAKGWEAGISSWLEAQRGQGWQAETSAVEVTGFPLDFNLEARDMALADPRAGWAWTMPMLKLDSAPTTPTRYAASLPGEKIWAVPGDRMVINSDRMEALVDLRPGLSLELRTVSADIEAFSLAAQSGWTAGAKVLNVNVAERDEDLGPENAYDLRLTGQTIKLPKQIVAWIDPTGWLRPSVDALTIKGHAAFDEPLDRHVVEQGQLSLRALTLREAGFEWGKMRLVVKGAIEVDDAGYPVGKFEIQAREWRQMIRLVRNIGIIDHQTSLDIANAVEFVTALTGSGDSLSVPLNFSGRKLRIGPIAIADALRLAEPR